MSSQRTSFTSSAKLISWDEDRIQKDVPRITPATVKMQLQDLGATVTSNYQMVYLPADPAAGREKDGNAVFSFTDIIEAEDFDGKAGSFVTQGKGAFDASKFVVQGTFEVVIGSGKGALGEFFRQGGTGKFESDPQDPHKVTYDFTAHRS